MLKNKWVIAFILILLVGAIVYNVRFFYRRMHPQLASGTSREQMQAPSPKPVVSPSSRREKPGPEDVESKKKPAIEEKEEEKEKEENSSPVLTKLKRALKASAWGRNPFFTSSELHQIALLNHPEKSSESEKKAQEIPAVLSGIIIVESEKMALINDRVMTEGEQVADVTLLKVLVDAVWVRVANHRRWLSLKKSEIHLVTEEPLNKPLKEQRK
jgi:hypothetical protein